MENIVSNSTAPPRAGKHNPRGYVCKARAWRLDRRGGAFFVRGVLYGGRGAGGGYHGRACVRAATVVHRRYNCTKKAAIFRSPLFSGRRALEAALETADEVFRVVVAVHIGVALEKMAIELSSSAVRPTPMSALSRPMETEWTVKAPEEKSLNELVIGAFSSRNSCCHRAVKVGSRVMWPT